METPERGAGNRDADGADGADPGPSPAHRGGLPGDQEVDSEDEAERESFPASDPPVGWAGPDDAGHGRAIIRELVQDPIPEADDPEVDQS